MAEDFVYYVRTVGNYLTAPDEFPRNLMHQLLTDRHELRKSEVQDEPCHRRLRPKEEAMAKEGQSIPTTIPENMDAHDKKFKEQGWKIKRTNQNPDPDERIRAFKG